MSNTDELRDRLAGIAEELADVAIDKLKLAAHGDEDAGRDERRITRARKAVEKAVNLLGDPEP
ncbi:MAG TPA: hypothetical protein VNB24_04040 [Acidimicrobiales bacterium]|nr:hypothetical protein [Acidimicrobiales bacterium]